MDSFFVRFRNSLVLIAIVLVQVIALAVQVQRPVRSVNEAGDIDVGTVSLMRRWSVGLMTPFERAAHGVMHGVVSGWQNYVGLRKTKQQNDELKQEVARLREEQASFAEDAVQGRRLQALLDFKQKYISETVAAQVIGTSGSDRSHIVWLDKGSADGLKPEQAVITPAGVVGKLRDVFPHTAQVVLLNDATSGAGVVLVSSRIRGILRGTAEGQVQIVNLTSDSRIKVGEQVVTSGGDMVFPRGLPVGAIESIVPDLQHQPYTAITIRPAANLAQVSEVLVITGTQSTLPASAQADADLALATEEEKQRAADVLAQKLPSLSEGVNGVSGATGASGATGSTLPVVPKAAPVLHPDKYSPGTTPSAEELRPGAKTPADVPPVKVPKEPQE
jgi:rod shape-determining protein MreC